MCDGVEDCPLGDDELPSVCSKCTNPVAQLYLLHWTNALTFVSTIHLQVVYEDSIIMRLFVYEVALRIALFWLSRTLPLLKKERIYKTQK